MSFYRKFDQTPIGSPNRHMHQNRMALQVDPRLSEPGTAFVGKPDDSFTSIIRDSGFYVKVGKL